MPRQLLRDGCLVDDDWVYLTESGGDSTIVGGLILSVEQWTLDQPRWLAQTRPLGIVLPPAYAVGELVPDLARFTLIAADFSGPGEGRGYSQGRLLRERHGFGGELRAVGYVRRDQVFFLARCGFNSFEMPQDEMPAAIAALRSFSAEYQPSNDAGLPFTPQRR